MKLKLLSESVKQKLSKNDNYDIDSEEKLGTLFEGVEPIIISRKDFENQCTEKGLHKRMKDTVTKLIETSKLTLNDILLPPSLNVHF